MRALFAAVLLLVAATTACDRQEVRAQDRLVIATGVSGSVYDTLGKALAQTARRSGGVAVEIRQTTGLEENMRLLGSGAADAAFTRLDVAMMAVNASQPFDAPVPLTALARLYDDYLHVAVRFDRAVLGRREPLASLGIKAVSTGEAGLADTLAHRFLDAAELNDVVRRNMSVADSAEALRSGEIDAYLHTSWIPDPAMAKLSLGTSIHLLPVVREDFILRERYGEIYQARPIADGTYPVTNGARAMSVASALVVRKDLPNEAAYGLTELLFASRLNLPGAYTQARKLDPRTTLATFPLPLHPGAESYYQRSKPMI